VLGARPSVVTGRVNAQGQLIDAELPLQALQHQAGGELGGVLAVPAIAAVAQMAQTLQLTVSRNIRAADGASDLDLIVRARPDGGEIRLEIENWVTLKRAVARFLVLGDPVPEREWLWSCDAALLVVAAEGALGADMVGRHLTDLFHFIASDDGKLPILTAFSQRRGFSEQSVRLAGDSGAYQLSGLPCFDRHGNFCGWRGRVFAVSLSPMKPAEFVKRPTTEPPPPSYPAQLNAALRPPLEHIIRNADDIGAQINGGVDRHYVDYAHDIAAAGRHLLGLVDDLSDLQSIESPAFSIDRDEVDLADIARRAASLLRVRAADQNVRIDAPALDEQMVARGDFKRILQILVNLISNAVRYSPAGAVVWVRSEREGDLAAIVVADQGKGIPADRHAFIFDKFARVDPNEPGGTGLGLFISRKLARAMGGDLSVDSAPGQGARFVLTLPMTDD